jgi:hypothetical protein
LLYNNSYPRTGRVGCGCQLGRSQAWPHNCGIGCVQMSGKGNLTYLILCDYNVITE